MEAGSSEIGAGFLIRGRAAEALNEFEHAMAAASDDPKEGPAFFECRAQRARVLTHAQIGKAE